ncbi:MAG: ABC transporter permease [Rhodoglobus sp.]
MTTTTVLAPATPMRRILNIVRLHLANPWTTIILPWVILGIIFAGTLAVWALILSVASDTADARDGLQYSGSNFFIFVYMLVVAVQAISITFPFALGYGVTRRDFYLGSALTFVLLSAAYSVALTILSLIEEATNGWGIGAQMFTTFYFGETPAERLLVFFLAFLFFFFVGAAAASVWVRWKATGLVMFFIIIGLGLIGLVALITVAQGWPAVGEFFATAGLVGSLLWSLLITAIAGVTGFFLLRRATPSA